MIAANAVEELRTALPALAAEAKRPAGAEGVQAAITPYFSMYPQPERGEDEWTAWWTIYIETCGHLPTEALVGGMKIWAALPDSEFVPKAGKLRELAQGAPTRGFRLYNRAHDSLVLADQLLGQFAVAESLERDQVKPPEQVEAVAGILAAFRAAQGRDRTSGRMLKPDREGPLDTRLAGQPAPGGHLTPEMYAAMGWAPPTPPAAAPEALEAHAQDPDRDFV